MARRKQCASGKSKKKKAKNGGEGVEVQPPTSPDENGWNSRYSCHPLSYQNRKTGSLGSDPERDILVRTGRKSTRKERDEWRASMDSMDIAEADEDGEMGGGLNLK